MQTQLILPYLAGLEAHNTREWYHAHKAEQMAANTQFEALLQALIDAIGAFDESVARFSPKELTFKLVRDTRFSADKSPYNPAFRAHISSQGKLPIPVGYYIMLKPGDRSFLGGGLFADMFRDATAMVRDYIVRHPDEWDAVLRDPAFSSRFAVHGSALKRVPKGYPPEHPHAEWLRLKSWYVEFPIADAMLEDGGAFVAHAASVFQAMKPLGDFLNRALTDFRMPEH